MRQCQPRPKTRVQYARLVPILPILALQLASFARLVNIRKKEGKTNAPLAEEVSIKMRLGKVHASVAKRVLSPQVRGVPTAPHVHHVPLGSMEIRVELSRAQIATPESLERRLVGRLLIAASFVPQALTKTPRASLLACSAQLANIPRNWEQLPSSIALSACMVRTRLFQAWESAANALRTPTPRRQDSKRRHSAFHAVLRCIP